MFDVICCDCGGSGCDDVCLFCGGGVVGVDWLC